MQNNVLCAWEDEANNNITIRVSTRDIFAPVEWCISIGASVSCNTVAMQNFLSSTHFYCELANYKIGVGPMSYEY